MIRRLPIVALVAGCEASAPHLAPQWGRWFSFSDIGDVAVSPDGELIVVSASSARDVATPSVLPAPDSAWIAVFAADGTELTRSTHVDVGLRDVQVDDAGSVYALEARPHYAADIDAFPFLYDWRLVAFDPEGETSWSLPWSTGNGNKSPDELLLAGGVLVVRDDQQLTGVSRNGAVLWQSTLDRYVRDPIAREDAVWFVVSEDVDPSPESRYENAVVRCDPGSGAIDEINLDSPVVFTGGFDVTASEILVRRCASLLHTKCETAAFDHGGALRWIRTDDEQEWQASPPSVALVAGERGHWQLATEMRLHDPTAPPPEDWIALHHFTADGHVNARVRRSFVEDAGAAADSIDCPASDAGPTERVGSRLDGALRLGDALLIVGRQGCRDAFLLALEESR